LHIDDAVGCETDPDIHSLDFIPPCVDDEAAQVSVFSEDSNEGLPVDFDWNLFGARHWVELSVEFTRLLDAFRVDVLDHYLMRSYVLHIELNAVHRWKDRGLEAGAHRKAFIGIKRLRRISFEDFSNLCFHWGNARGTTVNFNRKEVLLIDLRKFERFDDRNMDTVNEISDFRFENFAFEIDDDIDVIH